MAKVPDLLVSVRSVDEVDEIAGLADWIDLKEPSAGALGAVAPMIAVAAAKRIARTTSLSAAAGELRDWGHAESQGLCRCADVSVLKLGLSGLADDPHWPRLWTAAQRQIAAAGQQLAAVAYADEQAASAPSPEQVLEIALSTGARFLLVDTWNKAAGSLLDWMPAPRLAKLFSIAQASGVTTVAAGSLRRCHLAELPQEVIDVIAVRGAVCPDDRTGAVSRRLAAAFRAGLRGDVD